MLTLPFTAYLGVLLGTFSVLVSSINEGCTVKSNVKFGRVTVK